VISTLLQPGSAAGTIVDELTRRRLLSGGIGAAALLVAGCGSADGTDTSDAGATGAAGTRTITDDAGDEVTVPARPQRIVSTWSYGAAALLEAGAPVVGLPLSTEPLFEEDLAARHDLGDVADIGTVDALNVELVASLTPDLIVVALLGGEPTADDATLDSLRAIAPVVQLEVFQSVESLTATVADLTGDDAAVEAAREDFEAALTQLRELLGVPGLSVSFALHFAPDGVFTYAPDGIPAVDVLTRAGAQWLPIVDEAEANGGDLQLSLERVGDLSADLVVVYNLGDADLTANDVASALPANAAGQVVVLPETHQAVTWTNYTALAEQLTEIIAAVAPLDPDVVREAP
jgi:iron complex transport system substrate-binding protein